MSLSPSRGLGPLVSIVVPTRGRPAELVRFIESLESTVASPESAELILVVDSDDGSWRKLPKTRITIKRREVRPGLSMGELNSEGYAIAEGQWIFLLNDDVVVRTNGWDQSLREATRLFHDRICLIHVNDGIFQDKLCTFPIVSRTFCEIAGGICPKEYNRYRIDDHIYHLFNLLCFSGYHRIVYFEELVFEHLNRALAHRGIKAYQPNPTIHAIDTEIFESYAPRRKEVALDLVDHIEGTRLTQRRQTLAGRFSELHDSVALRRPEYVTRLSRVTSLPAPAPRVTIGIVSANLRVEHARLCIDAVKRFTSDFDLVVLDNNRGPDFNHPREMNRILSICQTDLLVLMDDDVIVEAGWLDGMLRAMGPDVGVVTPLHKNKTGTLSYAGVILRPDDSGHHSHDYEVPSAPGSIQTLCSAIMLIDVRKCAHVRIDESYSKYFLDLDYGLRIWEAGYRVVQSPYSLVTHIGGATLEQGSTLSNELFEPQRVRFVERWMHTGRWHRLLNSTAWRSDVHLRSLADFPKELETLLGEQSNSMPLELFEQKLKALFKLAVPRPTLREWANAKVREAFGSPGPIRLDNNNRRYALLCGHFLQPVLVESGFHGLNLVLCEGEFYALPQNEGEFEITKARQAGYSRNYRAYDLDTLKVAIASEIQPVATILRDSATPPIVAPPRIRLVEEDYRGYNIVEYDRFYAIRQVDGPFDPMRLPAGGYLGLLSAQSIDKLKSAIDSCAARLLEEGYKGFNLIQAEVVYGFPQCDGVFDVARARAGRYPRLVAAGTIEEARAKIDGERLLSKLGRMQGRWQKRAARLLAFRVSRAPAQPRAHEPDEGQL